MLIYLGYIILSNQVKMDLVKLKDIVDWKTSSNIKKSEKVYRILQLLLEIYQKLYKNFCIYSTTS